MSRDKPNLLHAEENLIVDKVYLLHDGVTFRSSTGLSDEPHFPITASLGYNLPFR